MLNWNLHSFQLLEMIQVVDSISWVRCASDNVYKSDWKAWLQGVTVGSEFGGTYENFYMAMWDPKGLMFRWLRYSVGLHSLSFVRGYLHVFVHTGVRQQWCR